MAGEDHRGTLPDAVERVGSEVVRIASALSYQGAIGQSIRQEEQVSLGSMLDFYIERLYVIATDLGELSDRICSLERRINPAVGPPDRQGKPAQIPVPKLPTPHPNHY